MQGFIKHYWKLILIIAILVSIGIAYVQKTNATEKEKNISTTAVVRKQFQQTLTSSGKTKADRLVNLKFQTSGKLIWVGVQEGDAVAKGQAIASLDNREVQKNLQKALRDYDSARNDFDETKFETYEGKTINDVFTDTAKRILQKNQWDLEKAVLDVELKHIAVELSTLTSPIDGIVTAIDTPVAGVNITPASSVFTVVDPASILFEANIDETDIGNLQIGQQVTITLDAFPDRPMTGQVSFISYQAQQSNGGATVFPVKVTFSTPEQLRIGLNGDIQILLSHQQDVLTIPREALQEENDSYFVYKKIDDQYIKTSVTIGDRNEDIIVITQGLTVDDLVVTKGFTNIAQ